MINLEAIRARNEHRKGNRSRDHSVSLCDWCQTIFDDFEALIAEVERQAKEIAVDDELLADRQRLLDVLPCEAHGSCIPHAIEEVQRLRAEVERMRAINDCNDCFMEKYHGRNQFCGQHAP